MDDYEESCPECGFNQKDQDEREKEQKKKYKELKAKYLATVNKHIAEKIEYVKDIGKLYDRIRRLEDKRAVSRH